MKFEIIYTSDHAAVMKTRKSKHNPYRFKVVRRSHNVNGHWPIWETNDQLAACEYARLTK